MAASKPLVISVKEARKLLGKTNKSLTNDEVKALIFDAELLSQFVVQQFLVRKSGVVKYKK